MRATCRFPYDGSTPINEVRRSMQDESPSNIVSLPFLAAVRAASAPAMGRFGALYGGSDAMQDVYRRIGKVAPLRCTIFVTPHKERLIEYSFPLNCWPCRMPRATRLGAHRRRQKPNSVSPRAPISWASLS